MSDQYQQYPQIMTTKHDSLVYRPTYQNQQDRRSLDFFANAQNHPNGFRGSYFSILEQRPSFVKSQKFRSSEEYETFSGQLTNTSSNHIFKFDDLKKLSLQFSETIYEDHSHQSESDSEILEIEMNTSNKKKPKRKSKKKKSQKKSDQFLQIPQQTNQKKNSGEIKYKTEICKKWSEMGRCNYGKKCQFAHGKDDINPLFLTGNSKYKSKMCRSYSVQNACLYGWRCQFKHESRDIAEIQKDYVYQKIINNSEHYFNILNQQLNQENLEWYNASTSDTQWSHLTKKQTKIKIDDWVNQEQSLLRWIDDLSSEDLNNDQTSNQASSCADSLSKII